MIRENLNIGENCVIGAGQAVLRNVKDKTVFRP
jgi:acetyltransferase-like isoleucine patch superfamily enzyme